MGERVSPEAVEIEPLGTVPKGLYEDSGEQPFAESEELRGLIALGRERGYLTFEHIAGTLEEVEVTKEQQAEFIQIPPPASCSSGGAPRTARC